MRTSKQPSPGVPSTAVPVEIQAADGHGGGKGVVTLAKPGFGRRLRGAAAFFLIGLVVGILLLPVPLIHLFGIMFFLGMSGLALRRLIVGRVIQSAAGRCPSCQRDSSL